MSKLNLVVYKEGEFAFTLNGALVEKQGLNQKQVDKIKALHIERIRWEKRLETAKNKLWIKIIYNVWTDIQYDLQEAWGFKKDSNFHASYELPLCTCPKIDNYERLGTPYRIFTIGCPLHEAIK